MRVGRPGRADTRAAEVFVRTRTKSGGGRILIDGLDGGIDPTLFRVTQSFPVDLDIPPFFPGWQIGFYIDNPSGHPFTVTAYVICAFVDS